MYSTGTGNLSDGFELSRRLRSRSSIFHLSFNKIKKSQKIRELGQHLFDSDSVSFLCHQHTFDEVSHLLTNNNALKIFKNLFVQEETLWSLSSPSDHPRRSQVSSR